MPEEVPGISRVAVERSQRDFPRRDGQQQGNRRKAPRQAPAAEAAPPRPVDGPPLIGSRLDVRA